MKNVKFVLWFKFMDFIIFRCTVHVLVFWLCDMVYVIWLVCTRLWLARRWVWVARGWYYEGVLWMPSERAATPLWPGHQVSSGAVGRHATVCRFLSITSCLAVPWDAGYCWRHWYIVGASNDFQNCVLKIKCLETELELKI